MSELPTVFVHITDNTCIERICEMERSYDKVSDALKAIEEAEDDIARLRQYMDSGLWNLLEDLAQTLALQNL